MCNREVVAFEFPEEDIPPVSLRVIYCIIMGKKGLETIRLDLNHRGHGHCEIDTKDIMGGRLRLPINEKQGEVREKHNDSTSPCFFLNQYQMPILIMNVFINFTEQHDEV